MTNYELTVVGDGSQIEELKSLATGMNVHFEGFQQDVSRYYKKADVFVMPSLGPEGLPLVTIEAMSHGLPCLLSDLPVHREVSRQEQVAALFKTGDSDSLRGKLEHLVQNEGERKRYGELAYNEILQSYTEDAARGAFLDAFGIGKADITARMLSST